MFDSICFPSEWFHSPPSLIQQLFIEYLLYANHKAKKKKFQVYFQNIQRNPDMYHTLEYFSPSQDLRVK